MLGRLRPRKRISPCGCCKGLTLEPAAKRLGRERESRTPLRHIRLDPSMLVPAYMIV